MLGANLRAVATAPDGVVEAIEDVNGRFVDRCAVASRAWISGRCVRQSFVHRIHQGGRKVEIEPASGIMKGILNMPLSPLIRRALTVIVAFVMLECGGLCPDDAGGAPASRLHDSGPRWKPVSRREGNPDHRAASSRSSEKRFPQSDLFTDYIKFPDMERLELGKEKEKTIQINRGLEGWTVTPPREGKAIRRLQNSRSSRPKIFSGLSRHRFDYVMRFVVNHPKASCSNTGTEIRRFQACRCSGSSRRRQESDADLYRPGKLVCP